MKTHIGTKNEGRFGEGDRENSHMTRAVPRRISAAAMETSRVAAPDITNAKISGSRFDAIRGGFYSIPRNNWDINCRVTHLAAEKMAAH